MRNAELIREGTSTRWRIVSVTLLGLACVGGAFGLGFVAGRRVERVEGPSDAGPHLLAQMDAERLAQQNLNFYRDLAAPFAAAPPTRADATPTPERPNEPQAKASDGLSDGPARTGDFTVQVSSFQLKQEAKAYAAALERKGFRPFVVEADIPRKGTWYRVRVGRFADAAQARAGKSVLARSDIPGWVLRAE